MSISANPRRYAEPQQVRLRFPNADDFAEVDEPSIDEGLRWASAEIDAAARKGGYSPVPFACPAPDLINQVAAELAAGWVMSRPAFSACTAKMPENAKEWLDWARSQIELLRLGELDLGIGVEDEGDHSGVISSGMITGRREQVRQIPRHYTDEFPFPPKGQGWE